MPTSRRLRVLFLTQWFEPEPVMKGSGFAREIQQRGHEVEVATGFPNYPGGKLYPGYRLRGYRSETIDGIRVHRLPLYPSHDGSSVGRALNYLSFMCSALLFCLLRGGRYDVIYVYHPPITVGLAATISGIFTRTPFLVDIQDLWPDAVVASGMKHTGRLSRILGGLCSLVYRRAATVIAQSNGMRQEIQHRAPTARVVTIFNWADEAAFDQAAPDMAHLGLEDRFTILYAGNLGRVQALDTVIAAAEIAGRSVPNLQLLLIGNGVDGERLKALVVESGNKVTRILPPVSRADIAHICKAADGLVLHLAADPLFEITLPSKLQFYLAAGKPILVGVAGEAARIVSESGAGIATPPEDVAAMADAMLALARATPEERLQMAARARARYAEAFSFDAAMTATVAELENAVGSRG